MVTRKGMLQQIGLAARANSARLQAERAGVTVDSCIYVVAVQRGLAVVAVCGCGGCGANGTCREPV